MVVPKRASKRIPKAKVMLDSYTDYIPPQAPTAKRSSVKRTQIPTSSYTSSSPSTTSMPISKTPSSITRPGVRQGIDASGKASKGLRHFSMKVCKKVEEKGKTTYNEVADELVKEFMDGKRKEEVQYQANLAGAGSGIAPLPVATTKSGKEKKNPVYDEKNIRRRVYDALNVLMAMDIISKEKKEISWVGLPTNAHRDLDILKAERETRLTELAKKREVLKDLVVQQIGFKRLCERNRLESEAKERENVVGGSSISNSNSNSNNSNSSKEEKLHLPFIVVNTAKSTVIQCEMGSDRTDVFFNFSEPFEINDDNEILRRLGLQRASRQFLESTMPQDLFNYCEEHMMLDVVMEGEGGNEEKIGRGTGKSQFVGEKGKGGLNALLQQL